MKKTDTQAVLNTGILKLKGIVVQRKEGSHLLGTGVKTADEIVRLVSSTREYEAYVFLLSCLNDSDYSGSHNVIAEELRVTLSHHYLPITKKK